MSKGFELLLFTIDPALAREAVASGVGGIVIDWEHIGKQDRQSSANTQINRDTVEDLARMRSSTASRIICRINSYGPETEDEIEQAIAAGADELLMPMVRTTEEVMDVLDQTRGRCRIGILIETVAALHILEGLAGLPLARAYVGLNDLAIERGTQNIFTALVDGTVERIRDAFDVPFGFGGLTLPERGSPVPCRLLIGEMARLGCSFSFLRRSFIRDMRGRSLSLEVPNLLHALDEAVRRGASERERDRRELEFAVNAWPETLASLKEFSPDEQPAR
ncbi:MAG TPA: aldolase/citrate lyase family protein [Pyrinomonadaceae bacterium]